MWTNLFPPATPNTPSATEGDYTDRVEITWNNVAEATGYKVYRCTSTLPNSCNEPIASGVSNPYSDTGGTAGTIYYYRIKASNEDGDSGYTEYNSGYRTVALPSIPSAPSATDGASKESVEITWSHVTDATIYKIYRCSDQGTDNCEFIASDSVSPYDDTGGTAATMYYYRIKAANSAGNTDFSDYDEGYRAGDFPITPSTPSATDGTATDRVRITWNNTPDATSYKIYRCLNLSTDLESCGTPINLDSVASSPYDDMDGIAGITYYYRIKGSNLTGDSASYSEYDTGYKATDPPEVPTTPSATDGTHIDKVSITWAIVSDATTYNVYRCPDDSTNSCGDPINSGASNSYDDMDGVAGTVYYYRITALNMGGESSYSNSDMGHKLIAIPGKPSTPSASDGSSKEQISITWASVSGATSYKVYRCSDSSIGSCGNPINSGTSNSYNDMGGVAGTIYYYRIKASNSEGDSIYSDYDTGYKNIDPPVAPTAPNATDGLSKSQVSISWANVSGATSYNVYRCSDSSIGLCGNPINSGASNSYNDMDGIAGTTYYYRITASNIGGESSYSDFDTGYKDIDPPVAPTAPSATDGTYTDKVSITWTIVSGATTYNVYRCSDVPINFCTDISSNASSPYDDMNGTAGTVYFYRIKASNIAGYSDYSDYDTGHKAVTLEKPSTPSASDGTYTNKVEITWSDALDETTYDLYRCSDESTDSCGDTPISDDTSSPYSDTEGEAGIIYYYRIKAINSGGESDYSDSDSGYSDNQISIDYIVPIINFLLL